MKFAHMSDCHLGGWRQPELRELGMNSFKKAIDECIREDVSFVLITGDLFDSAYPSIDVLGEAFSQLKKLKEEGIKCYYIAGSHDYSASGKTFLSVLEKSDFGKNLYQPEERGDKTYLNPILHENIALYGYPGKKSGLEVNELKNVRLQESPGLFRIFALHTCIKDAVKTLPIDSINEQELPEADYYALGHLHIEYNKGKFVYAGPTFPNNFQELEELKYGSFCIVETNPFNVERRKLKIKDIEVAEFEISNALTATDEILSDLNKRDLKDKIVLLKLRGVLKQGKTNNIDFKRIKDLVIEKGGYSLIRSTSKLNVKELKFDMKNKDMEKIEEGIIEDYTKNNPSRYNEVVPRLIDSLSLEKKEGETNARFKSRLISDLDRILGFESLEKSKKDEDKKS